MRHLNKLHESFMNKNMGGGGGYFSVQKWSKYQLGEGIANLYFLLILILILLILNKFVLDIMVHKNF